MGSTEKEVAYIPHIGRTEKYPRKGLPKPPAEPVVKLLKYRDMENVKNISNDFLTDSKFLGSKLFENKLWFSSPTMHRPRLSHMKEAFDTNWG